MEDKMLMFGDPNYRCENCLKQDKLEAPRGWELFKRLMKGIWYRWILRRKPDTRYKTFPLPRFWCEKCQKYADSVFPLAVTELSQEAVVACHGESTVKKVSFVESLVSNPCCRHVFLSKKPHDGYEGEMSAWLNELEEALKKGTSQK